MHAVSGAKVASLSVALAYDAIAAGYDQQVEGDAWMRAVLHAHYARIFRPGDRVLDVGCGTGIDALCLAGRGVHVLGVDGSAAMIDQLRAKLRSTQTEVSDRVQTRVCAIQDLSSVGVEPFDGLISAFASLSSLSDLSAFADDAARLVRPGGRIVLHMLNRFSLWEWLGYVMRADWSAAHQVGRLRTRNFIIGGQPVPHSLYFADEAYRRFFADRFRRRAQYGLGALRPPHTVQRIPRPIVRALEWLDVRSAAMPLIGQAGRFFVLDLERLST